VGEVEEGPRDGLLNHQHDPNQNWKKDYSENQSHSKVPAKEKRDEAATRVRRAQIIEEKVEQEEDVEEDPRPPGSIIVHLAEQEVVDWEGHHYSCKQ
jgi:hypothetical protein